MGVETNGNHASVVYSITKQPLFGKLLIRGKLDGVQLEEEEALEFSQKDVDEQRIFYVQTNMSSPTDMFTAEIHHTEQQLLVIPDVLFRYTSSNTCRLI